MSKPTSRNSWRGSKSKVNRWLKLSKRLTKLSKKNY